MITTTNKEELRKFLDAFTNDPCSNVQLKEDQKEKYQEFVRELHDDEMPNNWRYQIIFDLLHNFVNEYDQDDLEDYLHEIADGLVDVYNVDLIKWVSENISRGCFTIGDLDCVDDPSLNTFDLIRKSQYNAIYSMGYQILNHHY